jgi:hypothetical protein
MLVGEPEGKRKSGRPRLIWEGYIRMDLRVRGCGLDTSGSGLGLLVGCCEHGNEPPVSIKCGEFLD